MKLYKAYCKFVVITCLAPTSYRKAKLAIMDKFSKLHFDSIHFADFIAHPATRAQEYESPSSRFGGTTRKG